MTVVVGFVGSDGALMASDTEATEADHTRYDVEKIWLCGGVLLGYSGSASVRQPLEVAIEAAIEQHFGKDAEIERWSGRSAIRQAAGPVLRECYQHHIGATDAHGIPIALNGALLVLGRDANAYWMLELDGMVQGTFYTEPGFHTVGSGAAAAYVAQSLMRDYASTGRPLAHLKLIAHRTVQTCIDTIGGPLGVGGHVEIWVSSSGAPFSKVPEHEMEAIANAVSEWRGIERESLAQVVPGGVTEAHADAIPLPEPIEGDGGTSETSETCDAPRASEQGAATTEGDGQSLAEGGISSSDLV